MEEPEQTMRCHVLRKGQVHCCKEHECRDCGRPIKPNEDAWVKVTLTIDGAWREVVSDYSCCRPIR